MIVIPGGGSCPPGRGSRLAMFAAAETPQVWIPFPSASLRPGMTDTYVIPLIMQNPQLP
jgi:hypothetical protein